METPLGINLKSGSSYNVVIADDSFSDRELLKRFLQASQFHVMADLVSGEAVLDYLKYTHEVPDILFLDYQMTPGTAIDAIKQIKPKYPELMIVIVTGVTDKSIISQLVKFKVNSFIIKPINKIIIDDKLIQLLGRKDLIVQSKVAHKKDIVKKEDLNIPPLPSVAHKVLLFESNSVSGSSELEQIILPDKSICADLLRIANSAYYGRANKVQTIKDAITLLGLKTVKNIVMVQTKRNLSKNLVYSDVFKKFLLELPILSSLIAFDLSVPLGLKSLREELFLLAMMRKVGMTILALNSPKVYTEILKQVESFPSDLAQFEKEEYDLNHIDVGMYIFNVWQMPPSFLAMMKNQLFTMEEFTTVNDIDRILRVADILARNILKIPLLESELNIGKEIISHYKAPEETMELFGEDYYEDIKSHPFYDVM